VQFCQRRDGQLLAQCQPPRWIQSAALLLDCVQAPNPTQRLLGHRTAARRVQVEELASDVSQASRLGEPFGKEGL
jgi:hypothetical protein